jgi:ABC-type Fe3+-hydroxamate transport system substrate-binding protein
MTRLFTDMTGREVAIPYPPQRIVSLVPSQTELLFDLGLDATVVGITKFCVHPEDWFRNKKRVGGTKTVHIDIVKSLRPDLIIANKEENTREQVEELAKLYPVWVSDIKTVDEGLEMIRQVGDIVGKTLEATRLAEEIKDGFGSLSTNVAPPKVAYYIWKTPWMAAGGDTFISDVISRIGWQNVLSESKRYPEISPAALAGTGADLVLLSSEPYPFKEKHIVEIKELLPDAKVLLVDGEMFSWYGSRMKYAIAYLRELVDSAGGRE